MTFSPENVGTAPYLSRTRVLDIPSSAFRNQSGISYSSRRSSQPTRLYLSIPRLLKNDLAVASKQDTSKGQRHSRTGLLGFIVGRSVDRSGKEARCALLRTRLCFSHEPFRRFRTCVPVLKHCTERINCALANDKADTLVRRYDWHHFPVARTYVICFLMVN